MPSSPQPRSFELIAGNPALDLVNTLDWRFRDSGAEELLAGYEDLLAFAAQSSILSQKQIRQIVAPGTTVPPPKPSLPAANCARRPRKSSMPLSMIELRRRRKLKSSSASSRKPATISNSPGRDRAPHGSGRPLNTVPSSRYGCCQLRPPVCSCRKTCASCVPAKPRLPLVVPRYQQEPHPPLVRYENLRQPHESPPIQSPAQILMCLVPLS